MTEAPAALWGKAQSFQVAHLRPGEMVVTLALADTRRAEVTRYSLQQGDFSCSNAVLVLPPLPVSLGGEQISYHAGDKQIAMFALDDGSIAYLIHEPLTRREFFGIVPTGVEDTLELIRYGPVH